MVQVEGWSLVDGTSRRLGLVDGPGRRLRSGGWYR